jgi:hypothetical protein
MPAMQKQDVDMSHGTRTAYTHNGCRCDACRKANAAYHRRRRHERAQNIPDDIAHGTRSTYTNWGCRCKACAAANYQAVIAWRNRQDA